MKSIEKVFVGNSRDTAQLQSVKEEVTYWENLANRSNKLRDRERAQSVLEFLQPIQNEITSLGILHPFKDSSFIYNDKIICAVESFF